MGKYTIQEIIDTCNINQYKYIYKYSQNFRSITYEELLELKYAGYFFINVDYTEHFNIINPLIKFMTKPLPDIKYLKKIKIK